MVSRTRFLDLKRTRRKKRGEEEMCKREGGGWYLSVACACTEVTGGDRWERARDPVMAMRLGGAHAAAGRTRGRRLPV
jgi:hypothetical protein